MDRLETIAILDEILPIVSDKLQVVSYKWLSRNFCVSSNVAKRLLQEFVEKYGSGLQVLYSLSGWLKNDPSTYHVKLVTKNKLSDAKEDFVGSCSIQVYSVQACLPKDPPTLWNQEFVQAEDLFKQPVSEINCLRDNRFSGVSNSFVKRIAGETPLGTTKQQAKTTGVSGPSKSSSNQTVTVTQPQVKQFKHSSPNSGVQCHDISKNIKTEARVNLNQEQGAQLGNGKVPENRKDQSDKISSRTGGGALASMWGRASAKSKPDAPWAQASNSRQHSAASAHESAECARSNEDDESFNIRKTNGEGNRKRRVVFDYSDGDDDFQGVVNLSSPDPPNKYTTDTSKASGLNLECKLGYKDEDNKVINEVNKADAKAKQYLVEEVSATSWKNKVDTPTTQKTLIRVPEADANMKDKVDDVARKRRKVLKTSIDERGREVTKVVWEGEELDRKPASNSMKPAENNKGNNAINRPAVAKKSPAVGNSAQANPAGKTGNKKAGNKDPKQGNILSFFKKV